MVAGIGGYGNAFGCPTVGGEVLFEECYAKNPLVNAFCLGIVRADEIFKGRAEGVGNTVFYVGAKTGRDGIHGATMASAEFGEGSEEKRPTVQVGDPFMEKILLEACLEAMDSGAVVGIQDMGAAGLTCSTCEMGARAGTGIEIDIARVPKRETGMTAYEVMLSESQERMLLVAERGREDEIVRIFEKWDLHAEAIGKVTEGQRLRVFNEGRLEADVPNEALTDDAPVYDRPWVEPRNPAADEDVLALAPPADLARAAARRARLAQHREQALDLPPVRLDGAHEHARGTGVRRGRGAREGDAARAGHVRGRQRPLLLARSLRGRAAGRGRGLPQRGRAGGVPIGATNCLNFGNPERPEVMGQFVAAVRGIADACRSLGRADHRRQRLALQRDGRPRDLPDAGDRRGRPDRGRRPASCAARSRSEGDFVYLLGRHRRRSRRQRDPEGRARPRGRTTAPPGPRGGEADCTRCWRKARPAASSSPPTTSATAAWRWPPPSAASRARSPGSARASTCRARVRPDVLLFAETPSRAIVTTRDDLRMAELARRHGVRWARVGTVGGDRLVLSSGGATLVDLAVADLHRAWMSLERLLGAEPRCR